MTLSPKEEAVLSLIASDAAYENYFFKKVSDIRWFYPLKEGGYFMPNKNPLPIPAEQEGLFTIPEWNILPYLERVSQQVTIAGNEKYIDELLAIITEVSNYKDSNVQHIDNYRTWYYFTKILVNLPNDKITEDIINLISIWFDSKFGTTLPSSEISTKLLPKFLTDNPEDIKKAEKIINIITTIKAFPLSEERAKIFGKKEEARFVADSYWLKEDFDKYSETIGKKCSEKVIEDLANKIKSLIKKEEDGTYTSFYDEPEYSMTEPLELLTFILKRVLLTKAESDVIIIKEVLKQFFKDKYLYFPKMAIYVIGQNMDKYSDLFWEILDTEIGNLIIEKTLYLGDELKILLGNLKNLSHEQIKKLDEKIKSASEKLVFEEDVERYKAIRKQEIYEALSHDQYFKNLYEEMKKITNEDVSLHSAVRMVEPPKGYKSSPLTKEEIIKMPNDKLVKFLATFKTEDLWKGPTIEGLTTLIGEVAKEMPEKFLNDMGSFKNTGFTYIYEILNGIRNVWNGKKNIDWNRLFVFIKPYIDRKEFWEDKFIVENDRRGGVTHHWIAGIVSDLIQDGTRDDAWAFHEQYFEKAEEIVFLLLDNLKDEEDKERTDYVTYSLNTSLGRTITALILLALRIARVNSKKSIVRNIKWKPEFKKKYEEILNNKMIEGFVNLGHYMPNLYYLDKEWVKVKIKALENEKGNKYWEAFVDGYLSIGEVYDEFYVLMRDHYQYGLSYDFKERRDGEHVIQHICIGYLRGREKLDDSNSLFRKIIDAWKPEQIKEIINYFRMQRDFLGASSDENEKMKGKIIEFWKLLYEKYNKKDESSLTKDDKQILSSASELTVFLPKIDAESYKWLILSAYYVHEDFKSSFFIKYLNVLKDKGDRKETAKYIGEIYLKMLEKGTPDHDQKHIRSIVEFLYDADAIDSANRICHIYGAKGLDFLKDIYEKYPGNT